MKQQPYGLHFSQYFSSNEPLLNFNMGFQKKSEATDHVSIAKSTRPPAPSNLRVAFACTFVFWTRSNGLGWSSFSSWRFWTLGSHAHPSHAALACIFGAPTSEHHAHQSVANRTASKKTVNGYVSLRNACFSIKQVLTADE